METSEEDVIEDSASALSQEDDSPEASAGEESDAGSEGEDDSPSLLEEATTAIQGALGLGAGAAAPAPAPSAKEAKPKKEKKKAARRVPKTSKQFFVERKKDLKQFRYTQDGNLQVPAIEGLTEAFVIELPFYRAATVDELSAIEEKRLNDLAAKEAEFNDLKQQLRTEMEGWRETGIAKNVMKLQANLQRLDAERTYLRTPLMWKTTFDHLDKRQIDFSNMDDKKKLGHKVNALRIRHHTFEEMVVKSNTPFTQPQEAEAPEATTEAKEETFIIFNDPADQEYGFLSPDTRNPFVFRSIRYFAPIQAYESERVKELGRDLDIGTAIRKQPTARMVRKKASELTGDPKEPRQLWVEILQTLVAQHADVEEKLRRTDTDVLVYAHPTDKVAGIGLPEEDENVGERKAWKGNNYLGEAWMAVRQKLVEGAPKEEEDEQAGGGLDFVIEDASRANREQEQRKGVFIARYKMAQK